MARKDVINGNISGDMTDANDNFIEIYTDITTVTTEIVTARDGEDSLFEKITVLKAGIAALSAASGVKVSTNDGTTGFLTSKIIPGNKTYPHTASTYTILSADLKAFRLTENDDGGSETLTISGQRHSNTGATADSVWSLPAGTEGDIFKVVVTEPYYIRLNANGTEKFRFASQLSAEGGYLRSNEVGSTLTIEFLDGNHILTNHTGLWTYDE